MAIYEIDVLPRVKSLFFLYIVTVALLLHMFELLSKDLALGV